MKIESNILAHAVAILNNYLEYSGAYNEWLFGLEISNHFPNTVYILCINGMADYENVYRLIRTFLNEHHFESIRIEILMISDRNLIGEKYVYETRTA